MMQPGLQGRLGLQELWREVGLELEQKRRTQGWKAETQSRRGSSR